MNILIILLLTVAVQSESSRQVDETVSENLKIFSLNNHDVLTSFNFTIVGEAPVDQQDSFLHVPGLIRNLFKHHGVESLRLSLTQGFWRSNIWGLRQLIDVPSGTFLLVKFRTNESIDVRWSDLLNQLNGVFCSSILNMDPALTVTPKMLMHNPDLLWRYGALSSETVCSENLKPWKKLLPCKQHGLVSLLEPRNLLSSDFHSISLTVEERVDAFDNSARWYLYFSANTVHSEHTIEKNYWSLHTLFGRNLLTKCNVMDHSAIFVEKKLFWKIRSTSENLEEDNIFNVFDLTKWAANGEFKLMVSIASQSLLSHGEPSHAETALNVHTFFSSMNQVSGRITSRIFNPYSADVDAIFLHMIPWQIRVFLHTLRFSCRTRAKQFEDRKLQNMAFTLAKDGKRPLLYELGLRLPAESNCKVVVDYETAFLKITDFPADANSGVVVSGPILSMFIPNESDHSQKEEFNLTSWSEQGLVRLHGEPLLILLPVPDFSMPFNVICLVCTSIAIFYGNVVTMTTKLMKPVLKKAVGDEDTKKKADEVIKAGLIRRFLTRIAKVFSRKSKEETQKKD